MPGIQQSMLLVHVQEVLSGLLPSSTTNLDIQQPMPQQQHQGCLQSFRCLSHCNIVLRHPHAQSAASPAGWPHHLVVAAKHACVEGDIGRSGQVLHEEQRCKSTACGHKARQQKVGRECGIALTVVCDHNWLYNTIKIRSQTISCKPTASLPADHNWLYNTIQIRSQAISCCQLGMLAACSGNADEHT